MEHKWKETFLTHSTLPEYRKRLKSAETIIYNSLKKYRKPYVAFSGGKDSTMMLSLILKQAPDIMVYHWDYGIYMPRYLEREIISNARKIGAKNLRVETSELYCQNPSEPIWYREFLGKRVFTLISEGYDAVFVGIRIEESLRRKRRIKNKYYLTDMPEIFPIRYLTWMDVWAYVVSNNLPYPSTYDIYCPIVGYDKARFVTFFDPEFDKFGASNIDGVLIWKEKNSSCMIPR